MGLRGRLLSNGLIGLSFFASLFVPGVFNEALAGLLYVSPDGSGETCSAASPCAISQIGVAAGPGDTWILKDGVYSGSGSILLVNGINGTSSSAIRVTAENPGGAILQGDGTDGHVLGVINASYWDFDNLVVRNRDNPNNTGSNASIIGTYNSHFISFRKMVATDNNTYGNNDAVLLQGTNILFEDSDILRSARNFLACFSAMTSQITIRRVYVGQPIEDHSNSGPPDGFVFYGCRNSINENSVAEGLMGYGFTGWGNDNEVKGAIAIGNAAGLFNGMASSTGDLGTNFTLNGYVGISNSETCLYVRPTGNYLLNEIHCVGNPIVVEGAATVTNATRVESAPCYLTTNMLFTSDGEKLWESATATMRFGPPVVNGINDSSTGLVRQTLGSRLNITAPGCLPFGY